MLLGIYIIAISGCVVDETVQSPEGALVDISEVSEESLQNYERDLMAIDGVEGVGVGRCGDQDCLIVFIREDEPAIRDQIPSQIDGIPIEIQVSGPIEAGSGNHSDGE